MRDASRNAPGFRAESLKHFRINVGGKRPFCCAVTVHMATLVVVDSAPILKRFIGQHASSLRRWVEAQGGTVERLRGVAP